MLSKSTGRRPTRLSPTVTRQGSLHWLLLASALAALAAACGGELGGAWDQRHSAIDGAPADGHLAGDGGAMDRAGDLGAGDIAAGEHGLGDGGRRDLGGGSDRADGGLQDAARDAVLPAEPTAYLEVYVLDLWGQPLPEAEATVAITRDGQPITGTGYPVVVVPLDRGAGNYDIRLTAPNFEPLSETISYNGSKALSGLWLRRTAATYLHGASLSHQRRQVGGREVAVHTLYLGLRHAWFSATARPLRRGNLLQLLCDGEEAWTAVGADYQNASQRIHLATWWWESDFELIRDPATHIYLSPGQRWANTVLAMLAASPAEKRVLVNQFYDQDGVVDWMTTDAELRAYGGVADDGFELMGQANPTKGLFWFEVTPFVFAERVRALHPEAAARAFEAEPAIPSTVPPHYVDLTFATGREIPIGSYHQKFAVIDGRVAYIGGMNSRGSDWDTSRHDVFEPRRMLFEATPEEREAVLGKQRLPDMGPRKDLMVRIEGPAVMDADDVFHQRWAYLLGAGVEYSGNASDFSVNRRIAPLAGGVEAQVTATMPQPFFEHGIAETWVNAVGRAEHYIYIEDQYFRIPMVLDLILARMGQVSGLRLVVVTKPVDEWTDLGCAWTCESHRRVKQAFPDRYLLLQLRAFDAPRDPASDQARAYFLDMDTHSKVLLVDDLFASIGSANKNNRGIIYEGELNLAVLDADWVRAARRRMLALILPPATPATDVLDEWWQQLTDAAARNRVVYDRWDAEGFDLELGGRPLPDDYQPQGLVYPLSFPPPDDCLFEAIGPDVA